MTARALTVTLQDEHDIADLMTGWIHRDVGSWDSLRGLFHPGARISLSWFSGPAEDFVDASARASGSEFRSKHMIAAPTTRFSSSGLRAVTETNAVVVGENRRLQLGSVTHTRFIDHIENRDQRWGIVDRACVYDFSSFTFPVGLPVNIDLDLVAKYPTEYGALAYLLEASGFEVADSLPVKGSDRERRIKRSAGTWLDGSDRMFG